MFCSFQFTMKQHIMKKGKTLPLLHFFPNSKWKSHYAGQLELWDDWLAKSEVMYCILHVIWRTVVCSVKEIGARRQEGRGEGLGWERERDAVAREQQPHRGRQKTTAGLSSRVKDTETKAHFPQVTVGTITLVPWRILFKGKQFGTDKNCEFVHEYTWGQKWKLERTTMVPEQMHSH